MKLTVMPAQILAGDSLTLDMAGAAGIYPAADGWAVSLTFVPVQGGTPISVDATGGLTSWALVITSVISGLLPAGTHRWAIAATLSGERTTISYGTVDVLPNPAANVDQRSASQRALDAIDAVLEKRAGSENVRFVFEDGRQIDKVPHADLIKLREFYAKRVANEKRGRSGPKRVQVRM